MGESTGIQWTGTYASSGELVPGATFNVVWGCEKVLPACKFCYAETFAKRVGLKVWGADTDRRVLSDSYWREPLKWNRAAEKAGVRRKVFCSSMADVFEDHPIVAAQRDRLWALITETPWLDWLLLTKRPENMVRFAPAVWAEEWPRNVWAGTTVENQEYAEKRIPHLLQVPAVVRFLSIEPMLGAIDLSGFHIGWSRCDDCGEARDPDTDHPLGSDVPCGDCYNEGPLPIDGHHLHWVIVGGESGAHARPFDVAAATEIVKQCQRANIPVFVKQFGEAWAKESGTHKQNSHGGDPALWPEGHWPREFPRVETK